MAAKKICFISLENIFGVPYLHKYLEVITDKYDIIYWNRNGINEECGAVHHYSMNYSISPNEIKIKKAWGYMKFYKYATQILKNNDYDGVILLTGNVAVLLKGILKKKYKKRYIVDIRDYYKESQRWYYNAEKDVIANSAMTVISSKAFRKFLPEHKYYVVHNTQNITREQIEEFRKRSKKRNGQIVISCIGGMRFFEQYKKTLVCFANDNRFLIRFIGLGSNVLEDFCKKNNIENVYLHDRFPPEKTIDFYYSTDIVMNLYGNNNPLVDYLLSNKLYYAAQLGIPILVCPNTYMEEVSVGNGFGFSFDIEDDSIRDKLYNYYYSIDWDVLYQNCDRFMEEVYSEEREFRDAVKSFILNL